MAEPFDVYRKWLGIPPAEQPANYYRLLGVGLFENDADAISNAADRQMAHVRTFQNGPYSALSQRLLNELAAARLCLLNPVQKSRYDQQLSASLAGPPRAVLAAPAFDLTRAPPGFSATAPLPLPRPMPIRSKIPWSAGAVGAAILGFAVILFVVSRKGDRPRVDAAPRAGSLESRANSPQSEAAPQVAPSLPPTGNDPQAARKKPAPDRDASPSIGATVDLLKLIDPERDAVLGDWAFEGLGLLTSPLQCARLHVPYEPPADYELRVVAQERSGGALFIGLIVDGHQTSVAIDGWNDQTSGLHMLDGQPAGFNASKREGRVFTDAAPKEIVCTVHPGRVLVKSGELTVVDWRGDASRLSMEPRLEVPDDRQLFLAGWDGLFLISKLELRPISPEPPPPARQATGEAIDVLRQIDIQRDAVRDYWRFEAGALVGNSTGFARLQTQVGFPAEYKLTARVERIDGGDAIVFGLWAGGKPFLLILDGQGAQLTNVTGSGQEPRPPSLSGPLLTNKQPVKIDVTVLRDRFRATIDGKPLFDWPTDYASVAANPQPDNPAALSLMVWGSTYRISEWNLTPLSTEAPPAHATIVPAASLRPREKVPDAALVRDARRKLESKYQNDWRQALKLPDRLHVARKIYDDSIFAETVPMRYALLREAAERTAGLGDAALACEALDELQTHFRLDALNDKAEAVREAIAKAHAAQQIWDAIMISLSLVDRALREEQLPLAEQFVELGATAARKSGSLEARSVVERRAGDVRRRRARREKYDRALARFKDAPDDPAASFDAGCYECFFLGQWDLGMQRLEQSPDEALQKIAALERVAESDLARRASLAEAWRVAAAQAGDLESDYLLEANYWRQRARATLAADPAELQALARDLAPVRGLSMSRLSLGLSAGLFGGGDFQQELARRIDPRIDFNFGYGSPDAALPGDYFSVRWTGWLKPPLAGKYVLRGMADDGFRLWLDGKVVLSRWGGAGDESKEVDLTEGLHALKVEYNEYGATAAVRLIWQLRDLSGECAVPAAALYHDSAGIAAMVEAPP